MLHSCRLIHRPRGMPMRRREFLSLLGGAAAAGPRAAPAQQAAMPVVGYLGIGPAELHPLAALRKGLSEQGYVEGRNVAFDFRNTEQYEHLPGLAADLVRLGV